MWKFKASKFKNAAPNVVKREVRIQFIFINLVGNSSVTCELVDLNKPIVSSLESETSVLNSMHSSGELIGVRYVDRQHSGNCGPWEVCYS